MKVTSALLKKYALGQCTPQEAQEVENWLSSFEDDAALSHVEIGNSPQRIREKLYTSLFSSGDSAPTIPLYKKLSRYAAVVFIIFAAFFGGRFTANTANANTVVDKAPKGHLYISGGHGAKGNLPGEAFKLNFDGTIRLYNNSLRQKNIQVGDTSFVLESNQTYYLSGSLENPKLLSSRYLLDDHEQSTMLEGDFSILRLDNK